MVRYTGAWDGTEAGSFLAETAVPLRLACRTSGGRLWMLSLWFQWDDESETLRCATGRDADVVAYLRADDEVAFEVSTNEVPYHGVRGNGVATVRPDEDKERLRRLLVRYLGGTDNDLAATLLSADREEVEIEIDPRKLYSWDFSERMADVDG